MIIVMFGRIKIFELLRRFITMRSDSGLLYISLRGTGAQIPTRAYPTSAGLDMAASEALPIPPGARVLIPTGVHVAIPEGAVGIVRGRSSSWRKHNLLVFEGTVDSEYRGELFIGVKNMGNDTYYVEQGDRLAQLIIMSILTPIVEIVDKLDETERGEAGFGSTGR